MEWKRIYTKNLTDPREALLVYALAERKLREELKRNGESIPNQVGKPTQNPTMRRVFQMFEGIDILEVKGGRRKRRMVVNLRPVHRKIIRLMGRRRCKNVISWKSRCGMWV